MASRHCKRAKSRRRPSGGEEGREGGRGGRARERKDSIGREERWRMRLVGFNT